MGENKHIKEIDAFAKKYVKEIPQEKPTIDFTANLMNKIVLETSSEVFKAKALITKKGWFVVLLLLATVIFIPFKTSEKSLFNLPELDLSFLDKILIPSIFIDFSVPNMVMYSVFFFGLMIMIQVIFLKNHFDKRFE